MFFILSKLLRFFVLPFSISLLCFLVAWLVGKRQWRGVRLRKGFLVAGLVLLLFFSNDGLSGVVMDLYEPDPVELPEKTHFEYAVLLSGFVQAREGSEESRPFFSAAADRMLQTVRLYKQGVVEKIIVTGGSGLLDDRRFVEAEQIAAGLLFCGVAEEDILLEKRARNTHENALFTKELLAELNSEEQKLLLLTSAFHLRRATACFEKQGLQVLPYGTHYLSKPLDDVSGFFLFSSSALHVWDILIQEWVGLAAYRMAGYI